VEIQKDSFDEIRCHRLSFLGISHFQDEIDRGFVTTNFVADGLNARIRDDRDGGIDGELQFLEGVNDSFKCAVMVNP